VAARLRKAAAARHLGIFDAPPEVSRPVRRVSWVERAEALRVGGGRQLLVGCSECTWWRVRCSAPSFTNDEKVYFFAGNR
jgi:hypothetical protein